MRCVGLRPGLRAAVLALCFVFPAGAARGLTAPVLYVTVNGVTYTFNQGTPPLPLSVQSGLPVLISYSADDDNAMFRHGWDIRNPDSDEEWGQSWCATCRNVPVRMFYSGTHRFFLQGRNAAGEVTSAEIEIVITNLPVTPTPWSKVKSIYVR